MDVDQEDEYTASTKTRSRARGVTAPAAASSADSVRAAAAAAAVRDAVDLSDPPDAATVIPPPAPALVKYYDMKGVRYRLAYDTIEQPCALRVDMAQQLFRLLNFTNGELNRELLFSSIACVLVNQTYAPYYVALWSSTDTFSSSQRPDIRRVLQRVAYVQNRLIVETADIKPIKEVLGFLRTRCPEMPLSMVNSSGWSEQKCREPPIPVSPKLNTRPGVVPLKIRGRGNTHTDSADMDLFSELMRADAPGAKGAKLVTGAAQAAVPLGRRGPAVAAGAGAKKTTFPRLTLVDSIVADDVAISDVFLGSHGGASKDTAASSSKYVEA